MIAIEILFLFRMCKSILIRHRECSSNSRMKVKLKNSTCRLMMERYQPKAPISILVEIHLFNLRFGSNGFMTAENKNTLLELQACSTSPRILPVVRPHSEEHGTSKDTVQPSLISSIFRIFFSVLEGREIVSLVGCFPVLCRTSLLPSLDWLNFLMLFTVPSIGKTPKFILVNRKKT